MPGYDLDFKMYERDCRMKASAIMCSLFLYLQSPILRYNKIVTLSQS